MANLSNINNKFLVTTGGNVGINSTNPGQKLAIEGSATGNESVLRVNNQANVSSRIWLRNSAQSAYIFNSGSTPDTLATGILNSAFGMGIGNNSPIQFYNGIPASVKMTILSSGNVGIGTASPDLGAIAGTRVLTIASPTADRWGILELAGNRGWGGNQVGELKFISTDSTNNGTLVSLTAINDSSATGTGGSLKFSTRPNGGSLTERMRIKSDGVITFSKTANTTTPDASINHASNDFVYFTGGSGGASFGDNGHGTRMVAFNSDYLRFDTGDTGEKMRITSAGNVGIGTGTTSPSGKLEVFRPAGQSSNPQLILSTGESGSSDYSLSTDVTAAGDFCIVKGNSNVAANVKMKIDSSGNVDIGTASATSSSKVTIQAQGSNGSDETALVLRNYSASPYTGYVTQEFEVGTVNMAEISGRRIDINNGEIIFRNRKSGTISATMIITNTGIIKGQRGNAGDLFFADNSSSAGGGIINYNSSLAQQSNNTSCSHFKGTTQNVASYHLYGNGSSSWSSDSRLKRDIETTRDGYIDDINKLRVVKYKWKNDENSGQQLGLIAQEVEKIFPSLVVDHEDAVGNGETYKSLKYSVLPTILLKGMQEQQKMIQELKAEIEELKK